MTSPPTRVHAGPMLVVSGRDAQVLSSMLRPGLREVQRTGQRLSPQFQLLVDGLETMAHLERMRSADVERPDGPESADVESMLTPLMDTTRAAEKLNIGVHEVARLCRNGTMCAHRIGRRWFLDEAEVNDERERRSGR